METEPTIESMLHVERRAALPEQAPTARRRRGLLSWLIAAFVMIGLTWSFLKSPGEQDLADQPADASRPISVSAAASVKGDLGVTLTALGAVTSLVTVSVKTQINGRLVQIGFEEGQMVKEGDFLAEIDPRPYRNALAQTKGQLLRDQALLDNARLDLERYRRLVRQDTVSRKQIDTQESLVRQHEGMVQIDQAQVDNAALNLDYCRITAPVAGRVGLRQVDLGNYVQASDPNGIVVVTQLQPIAVVFPVAEDHLPAVIGRVLAGEKLPVTAYDRTGSKRIAEGVLTTVDNQVDPTTGTVRFKAQFANNDLALFPNQFVNVRLLVETLRDATLVSSAGIQYGPSGPFAYVLSEDDRVAMQPVILGPTEGETVAVLSGIEPGARVVTGGADRLRDGAKVKAATEQTARSVGDSRDRREK